MPIADEDQQNKHPTWFFFCQIIMTMTMTRLKMQRMTMPLSLMMTTMNS